MKELKLEQEGIKSSFEEEKSEIVSQDDAMSDVKMKHLDCKFLKRIFKFNNAFKFFRDNKEQIMTIIGIPKKYQDDYDQDDVDQQ